MSPWIFSLPLILFVGVAHAETDCTSLLDRTAPVSLGTFVGTLARTRNIHALVDSLERTHAGPSFRVPLRGRTLYVLQEKDLIQTVMRSESQLPFVNRNFDASHGHFRSINSVNTGDALWADLHHELADIFKTQSIVPLLEKHKSVLTGAKRFNLNQTLEEFYFKVWMEYCFGPLDYAASKATRDRLIAVLGRVFHQNPVNRLPVLGAATSRWNRWRHRSELRAVDAELTQILRSAIAHERGAFYELFRRLRPNYPDAFRITLDNSFLAVLVYDFIHIVMLDTLAHVAQTPDVDRKQQFLDSRHHAFLYPFRFRVMNEDHDGFRKGDFVVVNLQKSGLYFSAGARFCPGAGLFAQLSRWTLDALVGYDLRMTEPGRPVVRSPNRDLPFMLSDHEVTLTKCPYTKE